MRKVTTALVVLGIALHALAAPPRGHATTTVASPDDAPSAAASAIAARVGGEPIFLAEVLQGTNSLGIVGQEHAGEAPGAVERMLERLVTARLLYLDGRDRGLAERAAFREDLRAFAEPILAARWIERVAGAAPVGPEAPGGEDRLVVARRAEVDRLRATAGIRIDADVLAPSRDAGRDEMAAVAIVGRDAISWRQVFHSPHEPAATLGGRVEQVESAVAVRLLADAARAAGLDRDAGFRQMVDGFRPTELVALVREEVVARDGLDDAGLQRFYESRRQELDRPEERKVQQIVVKTRAEADEIRALLASPPAGTTFYTLARDRSILPNAAETLGVVGWVTRAQGDPRLSAAAFALEGDAVSEPVETNLGFHLVRVIDRRAARPASLDADLAARLRARWNADRIQKHANALAAGRYRVELFPDVYQPGRRAAAAVRE